MRNQAIGMLQEGVGQWEVARRFDVLRHSTPVVVRVFIRQNQQVIFQDTTNRLCQLHVTKDTYANVICENISRCLTVVAVTTAG